MWGVYMGAEKSKNIGFVLYPCNIYHMMFLDFLKNNYDGYYIKHEARMDNYQIPIAGAVAEQHDEKEHLHVVVMLPYARTASGFLKSLPNVRYYKPLQLENINDEIKQQLFTVFDISYLDIPVEEVIQPIVAHCEVIHDLFAYSTYVLHKDIKSKFLGKKEYNFNDVETLHCTTERFQDFFKMTDDSDADMLDICVQMWARCDNNIDMFMQLIAMHSNKLVKYVAKHAYFINTFIINNRKEVFTNG